MKIKEVITKTGLTDRAIRLYIENELVKPEYDENYNGRKSIEFSENDVEQLKNIALLRKADFSIQEIKALQMGGETAQNTIKEYINRTNEKIQFNTEILEKIGALADEENITIETVCEKLSSSVSNAEVPAEDMELSPKEQKEKTRFTVISKIGMVLAGIMQLLNLYFIYVALGAKHPCFLDPENNIVSYLLLEIPIKYFYLIQFLICLTIYLIYKKSKRIGKKKDRKKIIAIILIVVWVLSCLVSPIIAMANFFCWQSGTTNPDNYLDLDYTVDILSAESLYIFPRAIPLGADAGSFFEKYPDTTKYYYSYFDDLFGYKYDVFAEWQLFEHSYNEEKERALALDGIVREEARGDWTCIYFYEDIEDKSEDSDFCYHYRFMLFAYNDKTLTVRYIYSSAHKGYLSGAYFNTVEW